MPLDNSVKNMLCEGNDKTASLSDGAYRPQEGNVLLRGKRYMETVDMKE